LVLILERLAELNHMMKVNRNPLDTLLILAIYMATLFLYFRLFPADDWGKKPSWKAILVMSIAAVEVFFLAPRELRWYAVVLGLIWSASYIVTFCLMLRLLKVAFRKGKWLGRTVCVASLILFLVAVHAIYGWSSSATQQLVWWFIVGTAHGLGTSIGLIKRAQSKNTNAEAGEAGDACNVGDGGDACDSDGTDAVN